MFLELLESVSKNITNWALYTFRGMFYIYKIIEF